MFFCRFSIYSNEKGKQMWSLIMVSYSASVTSNLTATANNNIQQADQAVFEADKRAVYK